MNGWVDMRQNMCNNLKKNLICWVSYIELSNKLGKTDVNRDAEDIIMEILNILKEYKLENLNDKYGKKNFPGIDLGDENKKIGVQVTSENNTTKFIESYRKIYENEYIPNNKLIGDIFSEKILFVILTNSKIVNPNKDTLAKLNEVSRKRFKKSDLITVGMLVEEIEQQYTKDYSKFKKIYDLMQREFDNLPQIIDDKEVIEEFIPCFRRPALITLFEYEMNLINFEKAITDTIEALNTGKYNTRENTLIKQIHRVDDISDHRIKKRMISIINQLINLRQVYKSLVKEREIIIDGDVGADYLYYQVSSKASEKMNKLRQQILDEFNKLHHEDKIMMMHSYEIKNEGDER